MTARTVTGNTILLTGSAQASQTVTFVKRYATISGVVITQSGTTTATTDASGDFSKALDCPADGSTSWTLVTPDGSEFDFTLPYGDGSSVAVTTLISAPTVDADAVTLLLDGYEPDLGNPGTNGHVLSSTTAGVRSWVAQSGGGAVDSVFARTGAVVAASGDYAASQVSDDSGEGQANVRDALNSLRGDANSTYDYIDTHQAATTTVHGIADTSLLLDTSDLGVSVQAYSAKTAAIAALTWAANSIILLTGTATASVQALAAHVVAFIQSATAADARTAIGAGTGSGDLLASNNLSELTATASTARTNIGAAALGANTFTGEQTFADQLLTRPVIKDYGETVNAIGSTGGGTQDIDLTLGNAVSATVDTSANTFTFSNPSASGTACSFTLFLTNGGSQTVNWPASVNWAGGTAPTLTAAGVDILTFATLDGGTTWYGFAAGLDMS